MEFTRNFNVPINSAGGYTLVNNWGYGLEGSGLSGIASVVTASNGRVYATIYQKTAGSLNLYELTSSGTRLISSGLTIDYLDGSMTQWTSSAPGNVGTLQTATLSGFDGSHNPTWNAATTVCNPPFGSNLSFSYGAVPGSNVQSWGAFTNGNIPCAYHGANAVASQYFLGIVAPGGSTYLAQVAPGSGATPFPYPRPCQVPVGGTYTLGGCRTLGAYAWMLIAGEGFNQGEACQNLLFHQSGLAVWQGGIPYISGYGGPATSGRAGNPYGNGLIMDSSGNLHAMMTAEAGSGPQEWVASGLSTLSTNTAAFSNGLASITVSGGGWAPGQLLGVYVNTSEVFTDTFTRANSSTVGNGWTDPNSQFKIASNLLQQTSSGFANYTTCILLRPNSGNDSTQIIQIPASLYDTTKLYYNSGLPQVDGAWGVVSRYQSNGSCYFAHFRYQGNLSSYFSGELIIGSIDASGNIWILSADQGSAYPNQSPGHAYALTLTTQGSGSTTLTAVLKDATTGAPYMAVQCVNQQPELQSPGQIGIMMGWANTVISKYTGPVF